MDAKVEALCILAGVNKINFENVLLDQSIIIVVIKDFILI